MTMTANQGLGEKPVKPLVGNLKAARLSTAGEVIDALGGTQAVAKLLEVRPSAVSNYRRKGFPARNHYKLVRICAQAGLNVADAVFGGTTETTSASSYAGTSNTPRRTTLHPNIHPNIPPNIGRLAGEASIARDLFIARGFTPIEAPILQPAAPFIDRMGEEMRHRLYIFTDPGGEQLCLRPDLTIPTALAYLAAPPTNGQKRLTYEGLAFRYQSRGTHKPEEFIQSGIEILGGAADTARNDEAQTLRLIIDAVEAAGVTAYDITANHLGLLTAFLSGLKLSARQAARALRTYHQGGDMHQTLNHMMQDDSADKAPMRLGKNAINMAADILTGDDAMDIAGRSVAEIRTRFQSLQQTPDTALTAAQANRIQKFMALAGTPDSVIADACALCPPSSDALASYHNYWSDLTAAAQLAPNQLTLNMLQGRKMAYYTGLAFELHVPALGAQRIIAAGGRYDDLLQNLGAAAPIPAIGGALMRDRVELAAKMQKTQTKAKGRANK